MSRYCEGCGAELPEGVQAQRDRNGSRVHTFLFCDDVCRNDFLRAQNIVSLETYRKSHFNGN